MAAHAAKPQKRTCTGPMSASSFSLGATAGGRKNCEEPVYMDGCATGICALGGSPTVVGRIGSTAGGRNCAELVYMGGCPTRICAPGRSPPVVGRFTGVAGA